MDKNKLTYLINKGKETSKQVSKDIVDFYDSLENLDINNDIEMLEFRNKKAIANANNTLNNGYKRLINKMINEEIKAIKESK